MVDPQEGRSPSQAISISRSIPTYFRASAWLYLEHTHTHVSGDIFGEIRLFMKETNMVDANSDTQWQQEEQHVEKNNQL